MVRLDLRAEPIVLCMPEIDKDRYYDVQRVDMYTDNYGYIIGAYWRSTARTAGSSVREQRSAGYGLAAVQRLPAGAQGW